MTQGHYPGLDTMINIAIVEDDSRYTDTICKYLKEYEQESSTALRISVFSDGQDIIQDYKASYDIILMDIEMMVMDGMSAATEIRKIDDEVVIIFITNMPQYAMEGYKVDALDYVLKPITYFALSQRIDRALKRMRNKTRRFISISCGGQVHKIDVSEIRYIEVQNHDSILHLIDGSLVTKTSLKNLESILPGTHFFRCHKWYLVNLEHVNHIENYDISVGESVIQVSRARKKDFMDALNNLIHDQSMSLQS